MRRAIAVVLLLAATAAGCGESSSAPPRPGPGAAARFLDRYVDPDGRVVRRDQGGDTVSEGQAYALLLAAATGDERRFGRVWRWTRAHLQRRDGLLAWHWRDGRVADRQPAADADLDAARALQLAARRFGRPALRRAAGRMAVAVLRRETAAGRLVAGPWARRGRVLNPSYSSPVAERALVTLGHHRRWARVRRHGIATARALVAGGARLPPDWARAGPRGAPARSAAPPGDPGGVPRYGFDAVRLPVRFAESCDPAARRVAAALWPRLRAGDPAILPRELDGRGVVGAVRTPVALAGAAAAAHAAGDAAARDRLLDEAEALDDRHPTYYGAAWIALARTLLARRCG
ncbi:glycosyl hydrolase family 8 [Capillimicrobium parvum]|uniref:Endoglucanase n=1 Tax=Capillimicrobium parvum TaxID=2884022 RepID=A0A9E6Y1H0_9ACTN|nr:glycosyl hydrolase family 8 [Capillimicrobium parvum]UGS37882.1 putative endoglucanase [Capillimicrobium parvum]